MMSAAFSTGFGIGLSLILAIGAQNAFVLRQGIKREHVLAVVSTCALSDVVLIALGVSSFSRVVALLPWLDPVMRYVGALFLLWFGAKSMRAALCANDSLVVEGEATTSLRRAVLTCLALTWLNPHVYLDTVVFMGSISTRFAGAEIAFASGAMSASLLFFVTLGYGARWLRPLFARPMAWKLLDAAVALLMWGIAVRLIVAP
ncbi:LysE/ArgO family amino acid transporter [Carnimonas bestiolae]|uniref:LysE/ArgO family amino acid transporter n=1 Tax=Carnimonas bestiolae TaxID=3402172 RepID=UPI003EDBB476